MNSFKKLFKKTDSFRRKATQKLVKGLVFSNRRKNCDPINKDDIKRILICRPNHRLGNQLLITPLIEEVNSIFPNAKIDLFLKGNLGKAIFENYPSVDRLILLPKKHFKQLFRYLSCWIHLKSRKYNLVINADLNSSSGRLATLISKSKYCLFEEEILDQKSLPLDYNHFAKKTVYQLREYLEKKGMQISKNEIQPLAINLNTEETANGGTLLKQINQNNKPTIGIYTYATSDKCYSPELWLVFYEALKKKYESDYNIIEILPVENISQINFIASHFNSKNIRELASIISKITVFISADCGIMHLASASKTPVIGLFKFNNLEKYRPYANSSIGLLTEDLNPEYVFKEIDSILSTYS